MQIPKELEGLMHDFSAQGEQIGWLLEKALGKSNEKKVKDLLNEALVAHNQQWTVLFLQLVAGLADYMGHMQKQMDAMVEHLEDLEDMIAIRQAVEEIERTGEESVSLEDFKKELAAD
jgi:hypothetical protein